MNLLEPAILLILCLGLDDATPPKPSPQLKDMAALWALEKEHRFVWALKGEKVGETRFTVRRGAKSEGGYEVEAHRSHDRQGISTRARSTTRFLDGGKPLRFEETLDLRAPRNSRSHKETRIDFADTKARVRYSNNGKDEEPITLDLPRGVFLTASDAVEHWVILAAEIPRAALKHEAKLLYPDHSKILEVTFERAGTEKLKVGPEEIEATRYSFRAAHGEMNGSVWLDGRGKLLQIEFPGTSRELTLRVTLASGG
ncbi:MAG TPA: DUF6134 family protein [Planctomycetota bacterium]|nr:DUF6134 family protein [Planctomycetota bacterium]